MSSHRKFSQRFLRPVAFAELLLRSHRASLSSRWATILSTPSNQEGCPQSQALFGTSNHVRIHREPTIFALSTAPGRSAIAIIRISGPACLRVRFCTYRSHDSPMTAFRYTSVCVLIVQFLSLATPRFELCSTLVA